MRYRLKVFAASRFVLSLVLCGLIALPATGQAWELIWADEFEQDGLPDLVKWDYDVGGNGWGNAEAQYYTPARPENARVEDGLLVIEARKELWQGNQYTSARLVTRDKAEWTYGRFEIRADLPAGRGTWPAIWMLYADGVYGNGGWPDNGEIDIMEHVGFNGGTIHGTVHTDAYNHLNGTQRGGERFIADAETDFHVYAVEWSPAKIDFFIDDEKYFSFFNDKAGWPSWPFDRPFFLILNIAVGGSWGGQQGIDDSIFPQQMLVDYVRVYRNTATPEVTLTAPDAVPVGEPLTLTATATDTDGEISTTTLYQGDGLLGRALGGRLSKTFENALPGCYAVSAEAVDEQGWQTRTEPEAVVVGEGCPQAPYLIEPVTLPGTIEAEYFDLGGPGEAYLDLDPVNTGDAMRQDEGVDIGAGSDVAAIRYVGWISRREWLEYTVEVEEAGPYRLGVRVASASSGGSLQLEVDGEDLTGPIVFDATGGDQEWTTVEQDGIMLEAGLQTLRLRFLDSGFNLDRFSLQPGTATSTEDEGEHPDGFGLLQNYPNPFNPDTVIEYTLPHAAFVRLAVFDTLGREVTTLTATAKAPGRHRTAFGAAGLPGGVYLIRLTADGLGVDTRQMVLLK